MRHLGSVGLLLTFAAAALAPGAGVAAPLDFLFGGPPLASRPAYRLRRQPAPPLAREIPLPVPRPHFSDDPAPKAEVQAPAKPELAPAKPDASEAPPESSKPPVAKPAESAFPAPQPPEKPAELSAKPAGPQTVNPSVAPGRETAPNPVEPTAPAPKPANLPQRPIGPVAPEPSPAAGPAEPPTPPPRPSDLATPPAAGKSETTKPEPAKVEPTKPTVAPSGATLAFTPRAPEDDPQCPTRLVSQKVGIEQTTLGPQPDARCTVVEPVHLADVTMPDGSKVAFPEHPTVACVTADSFSSYVRDMLSPLAKGTFGAPVAAVWTGPGLECRSRDHIFGAKLSAHGQGLAIDIAQIKLADGRMIEVGTPKTDAETAFETAARAGACGYFHTVLGPGSDSYHRTHWHFDLEVRGAHGDSKYCK